VLAGGVFLALTSTALGEFRNFHPGAVSRGAWLSLLYLDCRRLHHRVYRLRVADSSCIADKSRDLRLRESGCGRAAWIFPWRRSAWPANDLFLSSEAIGSRWRRSRARPRERRPNRRCTSRGVAPDLIDERHSKPGQGRRRYFARPMKPWASMSILYIALALFLTPSGVLNSLPSGPVMPAPLA
jgi:hypothetical protein